MMLKIISVQEDKANPMIKSEKLKQRKKSKQLFLNKKINISRSMKELDTKTKIIKMIQIITQERT